VRLTEAQRPEAALAVDREAVSLYLHLHPVDAVDNFVIHLRDLGYDVEAIERELTAVLGEAHD
jgi:hypothetical protein